MGSVCGVSAEGASSGGVVAFGVSSTGGGSIVSGDELGGASSPLVMSAALALNELRAEQKHGDKQ